MGLVGKTMRFPDRKPRQPSFDKLRMTGARRLKATCAGVLRMTRASNNNSSQTVSSL